MIRETLDHSQRARLMAAQAARIRKARLARVHALLAALRAPDYFQHNAQQVRP